jgi:hypothetical protein
VAKVNEGLTVWSKFSRRGADDDARTLSLTVCRLAWRWVVVCKVALPECASTGNGIRADIHNYESIFFILSDKKTALRHGVYDRLTTSAGANLA